MNQPANCIRCGCSLEDFSGTVCDTCSNASMETLAPVAKADSNFSNEPTIAPESQPRSNPTPRNKRFGEYELIEEIARGGMGVVFKARHIKLNRIAAVKMILGGQFSSADDVQRFHIEAEAAARLDHPGIVPIYEIGKFEGQPFFAMKYIDGGSLAEQIDRFKGQSQESAKMLARVATAVHHAHQRGILHRDLKPGNILLDSQGNPLVADLGLAKDTAQGSDLTNTGAIVGTPSYMPPEQAGGRSVTTAADIYSIGAILYELLCGRPPHKGETPMETVMKVLAGPPSPPSKHKPGVDRDIELICMKCLAAEPDERYSTAQALAADLNAWTDGEAISVRPPKMSALFSQWLRRNKQLAYVFLLMVFGAVASIPFIFAFLSKGLSQVYSEFPNEDPPLLFSFGQPSIATLSIFGALLNLGLIPSIGYLTAAIIRPKNHWHALITGLNTALVLTGICFLLFGSLVVAQGAYLACSSEVRTMAEAVWPPNEVTAADAKKKVNEIYAGLDQIEPSERSQIVTRRINAEILSSSLQSIFNFFLIATIIGVPIVVGTVIAGSLERRQVHWLVRVIRYIIAWWSMYLLWLFGCIFALLTFATLPSNVKVQTSGTGVPQVTVAVLIATAIIYLALRRWSKSENTNAHSSSAETK